MITWLIVIKKKTVLLNSFHSITSSALPLLTINAQLTSKDWVKYFWPHQSTAAPSNLLFKSAVLSKRHKKYLVNLPHCIT